MTPRMGRSLRSFHHKVARWITWRQTKQQVYGIWDYPPLEKVMGEAGFEKMEAYLLKRQNMVAQYIATRPILDLCKDIFQRSRVWVARR